MAECLIQKSVAEQPDLDKINTFTKRELSENEVYTFNVTLCNNDVDRDFEKFSVEALNELARLFVGKTGICDHSMKSSDQKARIYDAYVEKQEGMTTSDGEPLYCLKAKAYMLNNDANKALIDEIDAGIKKEVSVSCSMGKSVCSICGADKHKEACAHIKGREYGGKPCFTVLSNALDAYEFSFVAVPAQAGAGVTKSFKAKEGVDMKSIIKSISDCDDSITITKSQAMELTSYIDELKEEASIGEEYKKELCKEVVKLFSLNFPNMDTKLFSSLASIMTTKELIGFKNGMSATKVAPSPQLAPKREKSQKQSNQEFKI